MSTSFYSNNNCGDDDIEEIESAKGYADLARDWAIKLDGEVDGIDFSSKYWASQAAESSGLRLTVEEDGTPIGDEFTIIDFGAGVSATQLTTNRVRVQSTGQVFVETFDDGVDFTAGTSDDIALDQEVVSKNNIDIYFDGSYQNKETYEVSGVLVTFDSVIPFGVGEIEVVFPRLMDIGITSADNVTFDGSTVDRELFVRRPFPTVADVKSATFLQSGDFVEWLGYNSAGDGGGNKGEMGTGFGTPDEGSIFDCPGSGLQAKGLFPGGVVHAEQFGLAKDGGSTDDSVAFNRGISFCKSSGMQEYRFFGKVHGDQFVFTRRVNVVGQGEETTGLYGIGADDVVVTDDFLVDQKFVGFTVSHEGNTASSGSVLFHLIKGANGCLFDLTIEGVNGRSSGGFWLRGRDPNTGTANNNQYNNKIRLRVRNPIGDPTEVQGVGLWLYGENVSQTRANANSILPGSIFSSWSQHINIRGTLNSFEGAQLNPASIHGIKFFIDSSGESTENTFMSCGFDGSWTGDKVVIENNSSTYSNVGTFINSAIDVDEISVQGTSPTTVYVGLLGRFSAVSTHGNGSSLDPSVNGGLKRFQDDGVFLLQGGAAGLTSKLIMSGKDYVGTMAASPNGISVALIDDGNSEFRIVTTSNGTTFVNRFSVLLDGTIMQGPPGPGSVTYSTGTGSPEGVVSARIGSLFLRQDGGAGTTLYVKESGTSNTGWVAK